MKYRIKPFLSLLISIGFLLSCAQAPQKIAEKTLIPPVDITSQRAKDSTVRLVSRFGDSVSYSCGFYVDKDKIATNIHGVAQPGLVVAIPSDKETILSVEGVTAYDVNNNLVILKLSGEGTPLSIGDSDTAQSGESVSVAEYSNEIYKTTTGIIDSIHKSDKWFWIEATTSKESNGGPVLNSKGQVIGITVGYGDDSGNYAIHSNALKVLLSKTMPLEPLIEWRKREVIRAEAHHSKGEQKSIAKDYNNAIVDFDKAITLNPEHLRAYYKRATAKFYINDYAGVIDDCTHIIKLNPEHARAYNGQGIAKSKLGEFKYNSGDVEKAVNLYQEAIINVTHAIKIDPKDADYYGNRGISKCKLGDIELARGDVESAQRLYHEGIVDVGKSIQQRYMVDVDAPITSIEFKKGITSIVSVMNWRGSIDIGSGFFVDTNKIATNIHAVDNPGPVYAKLINNEITWKVEEVIAFDLEYDLVLLKVSGEGIPLPLGDSDLVQKGEPVVAVGYPDGKYKVTAGNVHGIQIGNKLLGTTAKIAQGNSGGPLLNSKGEVIGINTQSSQYSFAVPSNILKALLTRSVPPEPLAQWQKRPHIRAYAYSGEGEDRFDAGNYAKAIIDFDNAIGHNPKYIRAYNWRGRAKYHLGKYKADQGNVVEAQHLYQAAIDDYTKTIEINPDFAIALDNRGRAQHEFGKSKESQGDLTHAQQLYQAAILDYTSSIKIDPKYSFPYFHRAATRIVLGQSKANKGNLTEAQQLYQQAIDDYTHAIQLEPHDAYTYNNRGSAKHDLAQSKEDQGDVIEAEKLYHAAIDDFTKAISINPKYVRAYNNRGIVKKALGQSNEAEKDFAKAKVLESQ